MFFWLIALGAVGLGAYTAFAANGLLERMRSLEKKLETLEEGIHSNYRAQKDSIQELVDELNVRGSKPAIPVVTYRPSGKRIAVLTTRNLLQLAHDNGVDIATACGGVGNCGMCALVILEGAENLTPKTEVEHQFLGTMIDDGQRLACQCRANGQVVVEGVN